MSDEFSVDFPHQKRTFISKLNPECPPFEPSSFSHHIQAVSQAQFSPEDNNNNLHIQSITNGHHDDQNYYSTTIHSIEPTEHSSSQAHYIQETIPDNQHSTTSYHIEPVHQDLFEHPSSQTKEDDVDSKKEENTNQNSFQESNYSNDDEVLNTTDVGEPLNTETDLNIQPNLNEQSNEIKVQRELDEDEIPPAEILEDQSSTESESNVIDPRPLTELESPYEQHPINESSSSLPDVVAETLEQTHDNSPYQTEPDDVLGNESLLKQTITPGISDTRPGRNTLATVSYKLFLIDNITKKSRLIETITNESFFVGEYDILPAIDIVIQLLDRGEHASIDSDTRHCYGDIGCEEKDIPPVTSTNSYRMKIDLELLDWKDAPDIQTLSINDRFYWGDKKRQRGNFSYRRKEYSSALHCYRSALKFLDTNQYPLLPEEEEGENNQSSILNDRYIQVQNNLAQVYLLNNQYEQCLGAVNDVLKYDATNIKALFRQAKALFELGNYDQAIQPLKLLLQNPSKDVEKDKVSEMLNICETKLAKYQKNEKEIYKRMFQPKPTVNEQPQIKNIQKAEKKANNNSWWPYVAMGSAVLAAVGLGAIIKYR